MDGLVVVELEVGNDAAAKTFIGADWTRRSLGMEEVGERDDDVLSGARDVSGNANGIEVSIGG